MSANNRKAVIDYIREQENRMNATGEIAKPFSQ